MFLMLFDPSSKVSSLKFSHIDWSLTGPIGPSDPPRSDRLPRDIVVKPHYFAVKEVMKRACSMPQISFQGHPIQVFVDLSLTTIQRQRALKPLLAILLQHNIKYWWLFQFNLKFEFKNKSFIFATFSEGKQLLLKLGLISQDSSSPPPLPALGATKCHLPSSTLTPVWHKSKTKKLKEGRPP